MAEEVKDTKRRLVGDAEILALSDISDIVESLEPKAQQRVMHYLHDRWSSRFEIKEDCCVVK